MSLVLEGRALPAAESSGWRPWIPALLGLALLFAPTYVDLARDLWREDAYAHGPIVIAVFAWLMWRGRGALFDETQRPAPVAGALLLGAGLLLYLLGRTQSLTVFEVAAHIPVVVGVVLLVRGTQAVRTLAFPLFFLLFLVPLPGFVLEALTSPLKNLVSVAVEALLHALGYPVARSGVILAVGQYQMLVADACSGLNSLYSLFALGLLYTQLTGRPSMARTALVLAGIVPIAVAANIVRVLALVLITYHHGEEAAQGFMHGFAGMLVFVTALALLIAYDALLRRFVKDGFTVTPPHTQYIAARDRTLRLRRRVPWLALGAGLSMATVALAAPALKPEPDRSVPPDLERLLPAAFGEWQVDPEMVPLAPAPDVQANLDRIYRQIVSRTYVSPRGERMMLTVAHGGDQSDALKAHRQEVCYAAQGFEIRGLSHGTLAVAGRTIPVTRMHAIRGARSEPVTYWFTMGDRVVLGRLERLEVQIANGLAGRVPDGMLVRVSSLSTEPARAYAAQQSFLAAIFAAVPAAEVARFVGAERR